MLHSWWFILVINIVDILIVNRSEQQVVFWSTWKRWGSGWNWRTPLLGYRWWISKFSLCMLFIEEGVDIATIMSHLAMTQYIGKLWTMINKGNWKIKIANGKKSEWQFMLYIYITLFGKKDKLLMEKRVSDSLRFISILHYLLKKIWGLNQIKNWISLQMS